MQISEVSAEDDALHVKVRFAESPPIWRRSRGGDLLRILDTSGRPRLCEVVEVDAAGVWNGAKISEIELSDEAAADSPDAGAAGGLRDLDRTRGILIRRPRPMSCYLSILATYMHHLFFADGNRDDGTIPEVVWSALQAKLSGREASRCGEVHRERAGSGEGAGAPASTACDRCWRASIWS